MGDLEQRDTLRARTVLQKKRFRGVAGVSLFPPKRGRGRCRFQGAVEGQTSGGSSIKSNRCSGCCKGREGQAGALCREPRCMDPTPCCLPSTQMPLLISQAPRGGPLAHTQVHTRTHTHTHTALTMHPRASVAQVWARNSSPAMLREKWTDWVREGRTWGPSHPPRPPPDSENWGNGKVWPQGLAASPNPWGFSQLQNIYFRAWRSLSTRAALGDPQRGQRKPQRLKGVGLEMGHGTSPWKRERERSWSLRAGRRQVSTAPPSQGLKDRPFCWSGWEGSTS